MEAFLHRENRPSQCQGATFANHVQNVTNITNINTTKASEPYLHDVDDVPKVASRTLIQLIDCLRIKQKHQSRKRIVPQSRSKE